MDSTSSYAQLGLLEEKRSAPEQALTWVIRCVSLFDEVPHPSTGPGHRQLRRLTAQLGVQILEDAWHHATGNRLPDAVREYALTTD
ncbi:hypothetical protein [Streptomyces sp. NBC_00370]|uniref:hypothetical protein n=1 Tax=Streptomyces sp. NBC_00370 TaxID=2975728 RepID=UPI002E26E52A